MVALWIQTDLHSFKPSSITTIIIATGQWYWLGVLWDTSNRNPK